LSDRPGENAELAQRAISPVSKKSPTAGDSRGQQEIQGTRNPNKGNGLASEFAKVARHRFLVSRSNGSKSRRLHQIDLFESGPKGLRAQDGSHRDEVRRRLNALPANEAEALLDRAMKELAADRTWEDTRDASQTNKNA
jgi:hypothetical protein